MGVLSLISFVSNGNEADFSTPYQIDDPYSIYVMTYGEYYFADTCGRVYRDNVLCCVDYAGDS